MKKILLFCSVFVMLLVPALAQAALVYRWVDEKGLIHYSPSKPWGVYYETIDTSFSAKQRALIDEARKQKEAEIALANKDKDAARAEALKKNEKEMLKLCVEQAFDKMNYQRRRIEDDSIKEKLSCEYKFNKQKQKNKYDSCIIKVESNRMNGLAKLERVAIECFDEGTSPELVEEIMTHYRLRAASASGVAETTRASD